LISACCKHDELGLSKKDYLGNALRLDGYYISNFNGDINSKTTYFFYRDGIAINGSEFNEPVTLMEIDNVFSQSEFTNDKSNSRIGLGVFEINGTEIKHETWEAGSGCAKQTVIYSGTILNDSTYVMTTFFNNYSNGTTALQDTFRFREFSPKPDSTNTFVN